MHLISNVVDKFTCSCDTNLTYIGMIHGHLGVKSRGSIYIQIRFQQCRDTLMFVNHAMVTNIFLTLFIFIKHAILNTAQRSIVQKKT